MQDIKLVKKNCRTKKWHRKDRRANSQMREKKRFENGGEMQMGNLTTFSETYWKIYCKWKLEL